MGAGFISKFGGDADTLSLLSGSIWSLAIKISSAGLIYLMLVMLARAMPVAEYGRFGIVFNLASFMAVLGSIGIHTAILRWWGEYTAKGQPHLAAQALTWSFVMTFAGGLVASLLTYVLLQQLVPGQSQSFLIAGMALVVPIVMAEFLASALRAQGMVIFSQLPKDILWRLLGIILASYFVFQSEYLRDVQALAFLSGFLTICIAPQIIIIFRVAISHGGSAKIRIPRPKSEGWYRQLGPYWGLAVLYASTQYIDTVIVGAIISSEEAASYFAAARTAGLASLMLMASNMISAPLISNYFYSNEIGGLRKMLKTVALCISVPTVGILLCFFFLGEFLLALFDPAFVSAFPILLVLAFAHGFNALCGPSAYVLQLTGHAHINFRIMAASYGIGLLFQITSIFYLGAIGVALGSAFSILVLNIMSRHYCISKVGVDPTILALFSRQEEK